VTNSTEYIWIHDHNTGVGGKPKSICSRCGKGFFTDEDWKHDCNGLPLRSVQPLDHFLYGVDDDSTGIENR